jgi:hypothetical protein
MRLPLGLCVPGGETLTVSAQVDTGALSNWVCGAWLETNAPDVAVKRDFGGARAVDGRPVAVEGSCHMDVELMGCFFTGIQFRVMGPLPPKILLGR